MKKIFLSAVIALALCSYGYAQDDEEYEEEEAPAQVEKKAPAYEEEEEEEEAAPAPKKAEKKKAEKKKSSGEHGFFGIGVGIDENAAVNLGRMDGAPMIGSYSYINPKLRITDEIMLGILFGLTHAGATTTKVGSEETTGEDDFTPLLFGVQFDYFLTTPLLPTSIGADFIYMSAGEVAQQSASAIVFDVLFSAHAEITKNLIITGKVGLGFQYLMTEDNSGAVKKETSNFDFGTKAGISLSWFVM
jgi:hypothetical protein